MQQASCPEREVFMEFLTGKLDENNLSQLEQHLEQCSTCGDTVRAMDVSDTLVQLVRCGGAATTDDHAEIGRLLERLKISQEEASHGTFTRTDDLDLRLEEVQRLLHPAQSDDELGRLAHYRILKLLGVGGMGVVFLAEDLQLKRTVALKVLRPSLGETARERFVHEARSAAAIDHDHVITIFHVGQQGRLAFLAMQWLEGETLERRIECDGILAPQDVEMIGGQIADGLAAAHAKLLIHRDIKPANVWLEEQRGRARILDFGLARAVDSAEQLTETGYIAGTPAYMSPEQARGQTIDERSDLFSLGAMLYRMSTGRLPFPGTNALATLRAIQHDTPAAPRQVNAKTSETISNLIMQLLEKDPAARPRSAAHVAEALRCKTSLARPTSRRIGKPTLSEFHRWGVGVALGVIIVCVSFFSPAVYRIVTDQGVVELRSNDPNVQVEIHHGGSLIRVLDAMTNDVVTISAGEYEVRLADESSKVRLDRNAFRLERNGREIVSVQSVDNSHPATASNSTPFPNRIGIGTPLWIDVSNSLIDAPIQGWYLVEPSGKVPLGAAYGRVHVLGLELEQAESVIRAALKEIIAEPQVSVTMHPVGAKFGGRLVPPVPDVRTVSTRIRPGTTLWLQGSGTLPEAPIGGRYVVEPSGKLPLGPAYGRVTVAGFTVEEAEAIIETHLSELLKEPRVMVTYTPIGSRDGD